jgi:hypothetical protein
MDYEEIKIIISHLSKARMNTYKVFIENNHYCEENLPEELTLFRLYKTNIELSKDLYEILCHFEVFFRNIINLKLSEYFGDNWIDVIDWGTNQKRKINIALGKITEKKKSYTNDDIIANVSLGFWTNIFDGFYEQILWKDVLNKAFPRKTSRHVLHKALGNIYNIRNRVSHHETIINCEVSKVIYNILTILKFLNPTLLKFMKITTKASIYIKEFEKESINFTKILP